MAFIDFPFISDPTPIAIYEILSEYLDSNWWEWEPETLRMEIPGEIPEHRWAVIFATMAAVNQAKNDDRTWTPWTEPDIFGDIAVTFQGIQHNPEFWQKPLLHQIIYAIEAMKYFDHTELIEEDVKAYIAACLVYDNVFFYPFNDQFIKDKIKELSKKPDLVDEVYNTWNNVKERKRLIKFPQNTVIGIQILRIEASRILVEERLNLGQRQISFCSSKK